MTVPADSTIPTKLLSIDYTCFIFPYNFFFLLLIIAIMRAFSERLEKSKFFYFLQKFIQKLT